MPPVRERVLKHTGLSTRLLYGLPLYGSIHQLRSTISGGIIVETLATRLIGGEGRAEKGLAQAARILVINDDEALVVV